MRLIALMTCLWIGAAMSGPVAAQSQDETLADIRQELSVLYVEVKKLKRELSTTGAAGGLTAGGNSLQRLDAIEAEVQRLTSKTEQLEHHINRVVTDGTNRIGDLEFRLVELEGGDVSKLGDTPTLGGGDPAPTPAAATPSTSPDTQLAVSEEADYRRAEAALTDKDYAQAAALFATFNENYPGSPLETQSQVGRGKALEGMGELSQSARAFLAAFSGAPDGPFAPEALFHLGRMLGELDQTEEACVTLREIGVRFPSSAFVAQARTEMQARTCQ